MRCINPKMKKLVSLYQFDLLDEPEKISVEAHLIECDACFEELYQLSPAIETIEEMPHCFSDALKPRETNTAKVVKFFKKARRSIMNVIDPIFKTFAEWWKIPAFRIFAPAMVMALLVLILIYPNSKQYSDLAILDNASYLTLKFRGIVNGFTPTDDLLHQGIKYYEQNNYTEAIPKLIAYVDRKDDDPYGHFYLGVSFLMADEFKKGIGHLKTAVNFCQKQGKEILLEKCYWYLGNAYLKINDVEKSTMEFQKVLSIKGQYEPDARKQMSRIEELRKK